MKSALRLDGSSVAPQTTGSTRQPEDMSLPLSFKPESLSWLPDLVPVECPQCHKQFEKTRTAIGWIRTPGAPLCCPNACREIYRRRNDPDVVTLTCHQCGELFTRTQEAVAIAQHIGTTRMVCSKSCAGKLGRSMADKRCPQCGDTFRPRSHRTAHCSRTCANAAHSKRMTGAGNSHFKDGTSYADWFRQMRPLIVERDRGCCVTCQQVPKPVVYMWRNKRREISGIRIHHIDENPRDNRPDNLVTLCNTCHITHHKSNATPWPWLGDYAVQANRSMTSRWKQMVTSLEIKYF